MGYLKSQNILISQGNFKGDELTNQVAIVTGGGSGIGYEAARALAWLGCQIIIAEINEISGQNAEKLINNEFGHNKAIFHHTDMGDEESVKKLAHWAKEKYGHIDIILNNATNVAIGAVKDVDLKEWDTSYHINLRGPIILIKDILPGMMDRNKGVIVSVSSSGAAPYMGPYEIFKMAQRELANTLVGELEGTEIISFTIGPGLVRTAGALGAIDKIAPLYEKTVEEFFKMSENQIISTEAAGAGFAAAIALASRYKGQEIGSIQALYAAGIDTTNNDHNENEILSVSQEKVEEILVVCKTVSKLLIEQNEGWKKRPMFEKMWVYRDFTKHSGMSVEQWLDLLHKLECYCENNDLIGVIGFKAPFNKLVNYIKHLQDLSKGYIKDKAEQEKSILYLRNWEESANTLAKLMEI